MNSINFKTKSIMKNFKKALKSSHHTQEGETVYFTLGGNMPLFKRNKHTHHYINEIIREIMETPIIHNNFGKEDLKKDIISILAYLDAQNALTMKKKDYLRLYDKLITTFENEIKQIIETEFEEFECYYRVENLKLDKKIKLGDVTLFPVDYEEKFEKINEKLLTDFFKENEVYAKTIVYGSKRYAQTKAQTKIKIVLNMLKLFLSDYECNFNLEGDILCPKNRFYVLINEDENITAGFSPSSSNFGCNFHTDSTCDEFSLYILSRLLNNEPKSEIENRLIIAIYWFGESLSAQFKHTSKNENKHANKLENIEFFEAYNKIVYLIIALESLFVYDEDKKSKAISMKVSALIANPGYENEIREFLERIYDYRSKIVHSGIVYISKEDINKLIDYTRHAIFEVLYIHHFCQ